MLTLTEMSCVRLRSWEIKKTKNKKTILNVTKLKRYKCKDRVPVDTFQSDLLKKY